MEAFQARHLLRIGDAVSHVQNALATAESGELGLLLDIDTYSEEKSREFKVKTVLEVAQDLHQKGLAVFQHCLTSQAWEAMGPIDGESQ